MAERIGFVAIVGAGPGDAGLLTLSGKAVLEKCDVVLYDHLLSEDILHFMPEHAELVDVGKRKGDHTMVQEDINALLLHHAVGGKYVVRLKGGDPYLFGRGGEEAEFLRRNNIPFRVIPGVSSALAAPAYAGIPITKRGCSSSVHIFTGHNQDGGMTDMPFNEMVHLNGTLLFLMSVSVAQDVCNHLLEAGMDPDTPAAVVENGTLYSQRRLSATVSTLAEEMAKEHIHSPAILIVGAVCAYSEQYDWTKYLPLWGKRALVVSSQMTAAKMGTALRDCGCAVDEFTGIRLEALPQPEVFWRNITHYTWIVFTSQFGAKIFFEELVRHHVDIRKLTFLRYATVGSRTAKILEEHGIFADYIPDTFDSVSLAHGLAELLRDGDKVLLYRTSIADKELPDMLTEKGIAFDEVAAYETRREPLRDQKVKKRLLEAGYDIVTFTSTSSVESFAAAMGPDMDYSRVNAFCIGEVTAGAARKLGVNVKVSPEATIESLAALVAKEVGKPYEPNA